MAKKPEPPQRKPRGIGATLMGHAGQSAPVMPDFEALRASVRRPEGAVAKLARADALRHRGRADEAVAPLIEDPWKVLECSGDGFGGCVAHFFDEHFETAGRDTAYYVRALEEPSEAINGAPLSTRFDEEGRPVSIDPCIERTDGCPAPVRERAWSSPIFVDFASPPWR